MYRKELQSETMSRVGASTVRGSVDTKDSKLGVWKCSVPASALTLVHLSVPESLAKMTELVRSSALTSAYRKASSLDISLDTPKASEMDKTTVPASSVRPMAAELDILLAAELDIS